jgi:hypothetical protein
MSRAAELDAYMIRACERGAFDWADNNCCQFAMRWVGEVEGRDPMDGLPETKTAREAWALIERLGGLAEAITQQMGRPPIAPAMAQLGDVVMYRLNGSRCSVGICGGRTSMLIDEAGASMHVPTIQCTHAWRVG